MMRIHFAYVHRDGPSGGANNFIRALRQHLEETGKYTFTDALEDPCDILFLNQLSTGPGGGRRRIRPATVRSLRRGPSRRVVIRPVSLFGHAFRRGIRNLLIGGFKDREVLQVLNHADAVIFQSAYQRDVFRRRGYHGTDNVVIHNGADPIYWRQDVDVQPVRGPLRFISCTTSILPLKRHDLVARLSDVPGVEVLHCGNWPTNVPPRKAQLLGTLSSSAIADVFSRGHLLFHPAVKDMCPNVIFEAICSGLPVIYNEGPGSSREIVGPNGFALDATDLRRTVERAREELPALVASVIANRAYFRVERAALAYQHVFDSVGGATRLYAHQSDACEHR